MASPLSLARQTPGQRLLQRVESGRDGTRVFVAGEGGPSEADGDFVVVSHDPSSGSRQWVARYSSPGRASDVPHALAVSPDGTRLYVTGASEYPHSVGSSYTTVAIDTATGSKLWVARFKGAFSDQDVANSVTVSPDSTRVYVTGQIGPPFQQDYATIAYDANTGARVWTARFGSPQVNDVARSIVSSPDGDRVFVTGFSGNEPQPGDYVTVAYDAMNGAREWVVRRTDDGVACCIAVSPDGTTIYVTGASILRHDATIAYAASSGAKLWEIRYRGGKRSEANSLVVSPDGTRLFITGSTGGLDVEDYSTVAYDASTGTQQWAARYNGPGDGQDRAFSIGVSPDGERVYVTGSSEGLANPDYATLAYDASTGGELWIARFDGRGQSCDEAFALSISPGGERVYVTGESRKCYRLDAAFLTLAYTG